MKRSTRLVVLLLPVAMISACASAWKVHGGPAECLDMCAEWDMELTGMVGVGSQERAGGGATACVCEVPRAGGTQVSAGGTSAALSGAIVALQVAQQQRSQRRPGQ